MHYGAIEEAMPGTLFSSGCCCGCDALRDCAAGRDLEITYTGIVNGDCAMGDCAIHNTTYIVTFPDPVPCSRFLTLSAIAACSGILTAFSNRYNLTNEGSGWVIEMVIQSAQYRITGYSAVSDAIEDLCNGEAVNVPFFNQTNTACDHSGATCTIQLV